MIRKFLCLGILIFLLFFKAFNQSIDRTVTITKAYDAIFTTKEKVDEIPFIYDTTKIKPIFNYVILPIKADVEYKPSQIKPAKISSIPVDKIYSNFIKIGIGNYLTPVLNYQYSSPRAKDYSYGFNFMHVSSGSKITLENKHKVSAGYYDNLVEAYGNKIIDDIQLYVNPFFKGSAINYYGYNTNLFIDSFPEIKKSKIRQTYNEIGINFSMERQCIDMDKLIYSFKPNYSYFYDKHKNSQHNFIINGNFAFPWNRKMIDFKFLTDYYYLKTLSDTGSIWQVSFIPSLKSKEENIEYNIGALLNIYSYNNSTKFFFSPKVDGTLHLANDYFNLYAGINGNIKPNTYKDLTEINPYLFPGSKETFSEFLSFYGGVKGLFFSKWGYDLSVSFNYKNHVPLFIKDTISELQNQFQVITDNIKTNELNFSTFFYPTINMKFEVGGIYRDIRLEKEQYAWHIPDFEFNTKFSYFIKDKFMTKLHFNYLGSRYSRVAGDTIYYKLPSIFDINFSLEYYYSKILTFYLNIYNLTAHKYQIWYQYPVQGLNFVFGITYKL